MKKVKFFVFGIAGLVIGLWGLTFIENENIDRFNPLVKEKDVYVLTKGEAEPDTEHKGKRYFYMLNGVDKSGNENTIKVGLSGKDEYQDCYLKVHVKGKYVYGFEEVQEKEVPEKAKEILKK